MRNLKTTLVAIIGFMALSVSAAQEYGMASVYSTKFQGSRTASGEIFNHNNFTAAHRTLPFGSLVKITRTDNGKTVIVKINDRGPFVSDRVMDISKAAATKLGFGSVEEARVKIEEVKDSKIQIGSSGLNTKRDSQTPLSINPSGTYNERPRPIPLPDPADYIVSKGVEERSLPREYRYTDDKSNRTIASSGAVSKKKNTPSVTAMSKSVQQQTSGKNGFVALKMNKPDATAGFAIQVASLSSHENMVKNVDKLDNQFNNVFVSIVKGKDGDPDYKIMLGPFESQVAAASYLKSVKKKNIDGFVVSLKGR
jgi:rare lipoprotein A